jgi:hypothetical protein
MKTVIQLLSQLAAQMTHHKHTHFDAKAAEYQWFMQDELKHCALYAGLLIPSKTDQNLKFLHPLLQDYYASVWLINSMISTLKGSSTSLDNRASEPEKPMPPFTNSINRDHGVHEMMREAALRRPALCDELLQVVLQSRHHADLSTACCRGGAPRASLSSLWVFHT